MNTKTCTKCKKELPVEMFVSFKNRKDGLYSSCKNCKKEYRQINKDKLLASQYARRVGNTELSPMRKAWNALYYALKTGKIYKPDRCSVCQKYVGKDKIQAHHKDYSLFFEVTWCCQDCHIGLDNARRGLNYAK